ncbi:MAG TPA: acyl-CoA dehydrogenase family protein, partial [Actinomycetota bacterium]|nr:acyl-CoA dehydrogenase family protein [Actinomycetota bacterium]
MYRKRPSPTGSSQNGPLRWSSTGAFPEQPAGEQQNSDVPGNAPATEQAPLVDASPVVVIETTSEPAPPRRAPRKEAVPMPSADDILEAINGSLAALAANAAVVDAEGRFPDDNLDILADTGAFGLVASPDHGGAGASLTQLAKACEGIGGACASTGMVFLMHSVTVATLQGGGGPAA